MQQSSGFSSGSRLARSRSVSLRIGFDVSWFRPDSSWFRAFSTPKGVFPPPQPLTVGMRARGGCVAPTLGPAWPGATTGAPCASFPRQSTDWWASADLRSAGIPARMGGLVGPGNLTWMGDDPRTPRRLPDPIGAIATIPRVGHALWSGVAGAARQIHPKLTATFHAKPAPVPRILATYGPHQSSNTDAHGPLTRPTAMPLVMN